MVKPWLTWAVGVALLLLPGTASQGPSRPGGEPPPFQSWRRALIEEAVGRGFDRRLVESVLGNLEPLPRVLQLDRAQGQGPSDLETYLAQRLTPDLVARGREMMSRYAADLQQIERDYGVAGRFVVAIWGAESGYGHYTGDVPVVQALATLAWDRRRASYFRGELFDALAILDAGHIAPGLMRGSWAGAMGQPQFMPSSFLEYAVDFDRDGRRDIWTSGADTLASIANYLHRYGWDRDTGWGREVLTSPEIRAGVARDVARRTGGCGAIRALTERRAAAEWASRGVRNVDGSPLSASRQDTSLLTLDARAFLVSSNYETILGYNCSHRYALSVSLLADRLE